VAHAPMVALVSPCLWSFCFASQSCNFQGHKRFGSY